MTILVEKPVILIFQNFAEMYKTETRPPFLSFVQHSLESVNLLFQEVTRIGLDCVGNFVEDSVCMLRRHIHTHTCGFYLTSLFYTDTMGEWLGGRVVRTLDLNRSRV